MLAFLSRWAITAAALAVAAQLLGGIWFEGADAGRAEIEDKILPLLLVALQLVGVLDNRPQRRLRRHAAVVITIAVAILTPGGDPISLIVLSVPMYLFYEVAILVGWLAQRRRSSTPSAAARS